METPQTKMEVPRWLTDTDFYNLINPLIEVHLHTKKVHLHTKGTTKISHKGSNSPGIFLHINPNHISVDRSGARWFKCGSSTVEHELYNSLFEPPQPSWQVEPIVPFCPDTSHQQSISECHWMFLRSYWSWPFQLRSAQTCPIHPDVIFVVEVLIAWKPLTPVEGGFIWKA